MHHVRNALRDQDRRQGGVGGETYNNTICHAELVSASNKIEMLRDPETSSG